MKGVWEIVVGIVLIVGIFAGALSSCDARNKALMGSCLEKHQPLECRAMLQYQ